MGIGAADLRTGLDAIAAREPRMAAAISRAGYPEPRMRERGYETLLRTIVGQQVSTKAATSIWNKLADAVGEIASPEALAALGSDALRSAGLSRQKVLYTQGLATAVMSGAIDLAALPEDDEEAIGQLSALKGIGRWSAEIYLLFAEGRRDIWPAGDLAVQVELGRVMGLAAKPSEKQTREIAQAWRPHRGAAAVFLWHRYNIEVL